MKLRPSLLLFSFVVAASACRAQTMEPVRTAPPPPAYPSQGVLADRVTAIVTAPAVARAHWGVAVTAMDGTPIFGLNEGQYFRPASNAKLFTTAAAMALLGPDKTFTTEIYGKLDPATGIVDGDLVLVGGGDPSFGSGDLPYVASTRRPNNPLPPPALQDLRDMVDQLVAKGMKRVTGRIVGDDTLFPYEPYPGSWDAGDAVWGYGAPVSALTIADNQMVLTVEPVKATRASSRTMTASLHQNGFDYYALQDDVLTRDDGLNTFDVERAPGSRKIRIFGSMPSTAVPVAEHIAIDDPALYAALALRTLLLQRGILVGGEAAALHFPPVVPGPALATALSGPANSIPLEQRLAFGDGCPRPPPPQVLLATHTSASLRDDIVFTNKTSQNLHAELFLHHLGRSACGRGSGAEGESVLKFFLSEAGVDPNDFLFYDGSGLSSHDLVTPRATAKLLSYASTQPWFAQWKASLPSGGEDGTLRSRFGNKSVLKGHISAKTGTLGESRALSGYLDAASGKKLIFSVFVDTHTPANSADLNAMDAVVEAIAAAN